MNEYMHHVPGRLRIRVPALKGDADRAQRIAARVAARAGVVSARASAVTGSLVIHYDVRQASSEALLGGLREEGLIRANGICASLAGAAPDLHLSQRLGSKVADKFIETLVERSAVALITALI